MAERKATGSEDDRRTRARTTKENRATSIVQALIRDPTHAARMVANDLDAGGDPQVLSGLLDAAQSIVQLRGVDLAPQVRALRKVIARRVERDDSD